MTWLLDAVFLSIHLDCCPPMEAAAIKERVQMSVQLEWYTARDPRDKLTHKLLGLKLEQELPSLATSEFSKEFQRRSCSA